MIATNRSRPKHGAAIKEAAMSGAASVGGSEKLMSKQYVDEVKYGESYVGKRTEGKTPDTDAPQASRSGPSTPQTQTQPTSPRTRSGRTVVNTAAALANATPDPSAAESAARTISVTVPAVAMPAFATLGHSVWHGAVEADLSLLEDLWDDERTPKGVVKASRRRHRRVHGVGAENRAARMARQARWLSVLAMVEPWIAAAEMEQKPKRRR